MTAKKQAGKHNPFKAGTGHRPPLLAGRDAETRLLTEALDLLCDKREKMWGPLVSDRLPPIKITGPRGVGKTALLGWVEKQAKKRRIRCVSCSELRTGEGHTMHELLANVSIFPRLLRRFKGGRVDVPGKVGGGVELDQSRSAFASVAGLALWFKPLLLLLDEVQHYELPLLREVLLGSQQLIRQGYPLGVVLAGTPGLSSHLAKAESTFITRCRKIRINTLDDAATREALKVPFENEGVTLAPGALEAMAAQTDNYPYFIQVVGGETWNEMREAGRKDVDVKLVEQIKARARIERETIYKDAFRNLVDKELLPQGRQVIAMLEASGGEMPEKEVVKALIAANPGVNDKTAYEICDSLREDGLIWTLGSSTKPGIPSFFSYFKEQDIEEPASDGT